MSSDSSDDENLDLIREATDSQFINDSMYKNSADNTPPLKENENLLPPSLRLVEDENYQFKLFNITPQFQNYVAKALSKKLEEYLKKNLKAYPIKCGKRRKIHQCIKLLRSSKHPIDMKQIEKDNEAMQSNTYKHNSNFRNIQLQKCKEVINDLDLRSIVVSGEDVLSCKEIEHWSNRSKAPIFKYSSDKKGILHLVEPDFKI